MGLFDFFPYTSGHTLNLDWIIKTVKKLGGDFQNFKDEVNAKVATIPAEVAAEVAKITPESINAAPAGFGVDDVGKDISGQDLNTIIKGGKYYWNSITNCPIASYGYMDVVPSSGHSATQIVWSSLDNLGCSIQRVKSGWGTDASVWGEWEWVNPPMQPGVEYRTTERWQGKAVYTMLYDFGTPPNNTTKNVDLPENIRGQTIIEWSGYISHYGVVFPTNNDEFQVDVQPYNGCVSITTDADRSNANAHVYLKMKYTKV